MQNVVGKFSCTPEEIRHGGPGSVRNREVLVDLLGFDPAELEGRRNRPRCGVR
jgi:hypothetical protein